MSLSVLPELLGGCCQMTVRLNNVRCLMVDVLLSCKRINELVKNASLHASLLPLAVGRGGGGGIW